MAIKIVQIRREWFYSGQPTSAISHFKTEYGTVFTREDLIKTILGGGDYAVGIHPNPRLEVVSNGGTRYVRSKGDGTESDNLLKLKIF